MAEDTKLILKAELTADKKIKVEINSNFMPLVTYALALLRLETDNRIITDAQKQSTNDIIVPDVDILKRN